MSNPTHIARILSPMGIYASKTVVYPDAAYVADDELSFSVCKLETHTRGREGEDESYSEVQWLNPAEVRLYGSLLLSFDVETQYLLFYPHWVSESIFDGPIRFDDEQWLLEVVRPLLQERVVAPDYTSPVGPVQWRNRYNTHPDIVLPPLISEKHYDFRTKDIDYSLARDLHRTVALDDDLYIRAIYSLIKSGMLRQHPQFHEQSIYMLYIAMEVCWRLVRQRLIASGVSDPRPEDAMKYIHESLHEHHLADGTTKWFEEYYEQRVMSFHPESRYGVVAHAPLYWDDQPFLYRDMIVILRFLICGYLHPRHLELGKLDTTGNQSEQS